MRSPFSPAKVIFGFTALLAAALIVALRVGSAGPAVLLNENQILYLSSTSAQVIAAVYGLTLTGFIFFRNELSRDENEDETLRDAVDSLKTRYFALLLFITALTLVSLLLANLTIAYENSENRALKVFFLNAGQCAFVTSLLAVAYFVFDVVSPKRIERASKSLQTGLDPRIEGKRSGSLEDFLKNYGEIEALLEDAGKRFQVGSPQMNERLARRRIPHVALIEILARSARLDRNLHRKLRDIIALRNAIIHGAEPVVSEEMVTSSYEALAQLKGALALDRELTKAEPLRDSRNQRPA